MNWNQICVNIYFCKKKKKLKKKNKGEGQNTKLTQKIPHTGDTNSLDRCG